MPPTNAPLAITAAVARRFLVRRHLLAPPRSLPATPESVLAVVKRLGSLQFDPLAVTGRNHDLVLAARISGYQTAWTQELLYGRRLLFEAYNKSLNLLPTAELPYYRLAWDRAAIEHASGILADQADHVAELLEAIRSLGPRSSGDFGRSASIDWWWGQTSKTRAVLEALFVTGTLGLARRDGNRRYFDLTERLYPADLLAERISEREQLLHRLLSRYRGHGLLGATGSGEIFTGFGRGDLLDGSGPRPSRSELLAVLVSRGELVTVMITGHKGPRYVLTAELGELAGAELEIAHGQGPGGEGPELAFLAPLDPLVWDRAFLRALWGFDYLWEVYTPLERRRFGYYVLPILWGDRLVGRIEPRFERADDRLAILGLWWEAGFAPLAEPGFAPALGRALRAHAAFGGVAKITWPPGPVGTALGRASS
jgi:hypothetical protein